MTLPTLPTIDIQTLPGPARKILEASAPLPLKTMAARAIVPGLRPGDAATLVFLLSEGGDASIAEIARKTLASLPLPILNGALTADLEPRVIEKLAELYAGEGHVVERLLAMPRIAPETVATIAAKCSEAVAELIAVNEERLLAHPEIIERLYLNKKTRMSTADRIVELAVRHQKELRIPAYQEVASALMSELIPEPDPEPTPDDLLFRETIELGASLSEDAEKGEVQEVSDEGEEKIRDKFIPLWVRLGKMTIAQKIRAASLGSAAERALLMREPNRVVAEAAIRSPLVQEPEVVAASGSRLVSEDVLRIIGNSRDWTRNHQVKVNLVMNPRTPFIIASKLVNHLRDNELRAIAKSKNVKAAIAKLARQQLQRKSS